MAVHAAPRVKQEAWADAGTANGAIDAGAGWDATQLLVNNLGKPSALFDFLNPDVVKIDENTDLTNEEASAKIAKLTEDIMPRVKREAGMAGCQEDKRRK
ncbi:uncharacterized protein PV07_08643 [Cladophialophora immunda]|uniref:Uncharacterized protein n=1 Tax=Cladophialophora immunda TaxID=569365 RepID=A0A0D2AKJ1_9EURO|nr:uncharacterized protein PV07_08643 [Cladophialophora immunda]KIW25477.1 hypothetical protein PV07_08643 [Cladophialophora immunda]